MKMRTIWYVCLALILTVGANAIAQEAAAVAAKVAEKQRAYQLYEQMKSGTVLSPAEKDLVHRLVGNPPRDAGSPLDNIGGPDGFGYRYKDNVAPDSATYDWIELRGDPTAIWFNSWDWGTRGMATTDGEIGFSFPFYGINYTTFRPSSRGQIEFGSDYYSDGYYDCLAWYFYDNTVPAILPYMCDLDLQTGGNPTGTDVVGYKNFDNFTVIEYDSIGYGSPGGSYKFEVILFRDGKIKMQYNHIVLGPWQPIGTVGIYAGYTGSYNYLQYRCSQDDNSVMPLTDGLAIWFYRSTVLPHDYACSGVSSPAAIQFVNQSLNVTALFANASSTAESSPVKYRFDNGSIIGPEYTGVLHPNYGTANHTFAVPVTMPGAPGVYPLKVWTDLSTDLDRTNDTARVNIAVRDCYNTDIGSGLLSVTGQTNCGLGNAYSNTCLGDYDGGEDITYRWTCLTEGDYQFRMDPHSTAWTGMLLSDHCPPDGNCIGSVTAAEGALTLNRHVTPGVYYIMIDTWPQPNCIYSFDFSISSAPTGRCCYYPDPYHPSCADITEPACMVLNGRWSNSLTCASTLCPPINDNCADVTPVTLPATFTGNVNYATHDCGLLPGGDGEVWHAFTISQCSDVTASYCNTNAAWNCFNTVLTNGCPCSSQVFPASSSYTDCANGNMTIHWLLPAGTYYLPVRYSVSCNDTGMYSIDVTSAPCPPAPNDLCVNAIALSAPVTMLPWNNSAAAEAADNSHCGMYRDIWYCWTTLCETDVNVNLCGSSFDTKLAVFNTDANCTCPTGTGIVCNDDACGLQSSVNFHALPGKYLIEVGSRTPYQVGTGVLTVNTVSECSCDPARNLTVRMDPNNAGHTSLNFDAVSTNGRYQIYTTTAKNNDGDPRNNDPDFHLAGSVVTPTVGQQAWQDSSALGDYKNYVVVHDCWPLRRCCYNSGLDCADNTHAQCDALGGQWDWTTTCAAIPCTIIQGQAGEDCSNPGRLIGPLPITVWGTTCGHIQNYNCNAWELPPCWFDISFHQWHSCQAPDVTYQYTVPATGTYTFSMCGSSYNTGLMIYNYTCPTEPTPTDFICGSGYVATCGSSWGPSVVPNLPLTQGQHILIIVSGWWLQCGNYVLTISQP